MMTDRYTLIVELIGFVVMLSAIGFALAAVLAQLGGLLDLLGRIP